MRTSTLERDRATLTADNVVQRLDDLRLRVSDGRELQQWYHAVMWAEAGDFAMCANLLEQLEATLLRPCQHGS